MLEPQLLFTDFIFFKLPWYWSISWCLSIGAQWLVELNAARVLIWFSASAVELQKGQKQQLINRPKLTLLFLVDNLPLHIHSQIFVANLNLAQQISYIRCGSFMSVLAFCIGMQIWIRFESSSGAFSRKVCFSLFLTQSLWL